MSFFTIAEIVVSVLLIALILVQERDSGTSGLFGGGGEGGFYAQRRGLEKIFFIGTLVLIVLFAGLALLNLVVA